MYYEFYLQDGDTVSRYLVYADSLDVAKEEFKVNLLTDPNLKYRYSGNSYDDLRSYLHEYPNVNCYILRDGEIDPIGSPSYKSESRYDKMSKGLRNSIREAVSTKQYRVYYKKKGQYPIDLPSELVSAKDEKSAETNFLSKYKNGGDVEIIKIYPIDESKILRESIIGLYGDDSSDLGDYTDLSTFISSCKKRGISVSDVEDNGSNGWELNLSGDPRIIYSLVNNRVRGYNKDSLSEFIDEYSLDESKSITESMGDIIDLHTMTREEFDRLPYGRSFMSNRASISVDGKEYVKLSPDTWQYLPTVTHALGYKVSVDKMWDIIQKGKSAQMVENKN